MAIMPVLSAWSEQAGEGTHGFADVAELSSTVAPDIRCRDNKLNKYKVSLPQ